MARRIHRKSRTGIPVTAPTVQEENHAPANPADVRISLRRDRLGADEHPILERLEMGGTGGTLPDGARPRLVRRSRSRRHHGYRQGLARGDTPGSRRQQLADGLFGHQLAHQVPGPEPRPRPHRRHDDLQRAAVRDHRPQVARRDGAEGPRRQDSRRPGARRRLRAVEGVREGERHRRLQGHHRERRLPGARTHARGGQGGRHHRLLVLVVHQPEGEGGGRGGHLAHPHARARPSTSTATSSSSIRNSRSPTRMR